jgi:hypothetical protein
MTLFILAYPEEEWKRLEKVVMFMPIDADGDLVDGKPERLPKQIVSDPDPSFALVRLGFHLSHKAITDLVVLLQSRHLLPEKTDATSQQLLEGAILQFLADFGSTNRRRGSLMAPSLSRRSSTQSRQRPVETHQARTSTTGSKAQPIERELKPYAGTPSNSECSSNEEGIKIERDRQPYTARPGRGKVYVERGDRRYLGDRQYSGRGTDPNQVRFKGEDSRKDAEKWDRYKGRGTRYKRSPVHIIDPRGKRAAE